MLNDNRERDLGTDQLDRDTDGDGVSDYREVIVGINPHSNDSDQDTVPDGVERRQGTAVAPDGDGDGTPDWVEVARDPTVDSDLDGLSDGEERWLRTDPNSATRTATSRRTSSRWRPGRIPARQREAPAVSRSRRCRTGRTSRTPWTSRTRCPTDPRR